MLRRRRVFRPEVLCICFSQRRLITRFAITYEHIRVSPFDKQGKIINETGKISLCLASFCKYIKYNRQQQYPTGNS